MSIDSSALHDRIPPSPETLSFRNRPCRFEEPSHCAPTELKSSVKKIRCPYEDYCRASSGALWRLGKAFSRWIRVTLTEPSSSMVVRSEHQYNRDARHRLSIRKHIYEIHPDATAQGNWETWIRCRLSDTAELLMIKDPAVDGTLRAALLSSQHVRPVFKSFADLKDAVEKDRVFQDLTSGYESADMAQFWDDLESSFENGRLLLDDNKLLDRSIAHALKFSEAYQPSFNRFTQLQKAVEAEPAFKAAKAEVGERELERLGGILRSYQEAQGDQPNPDLEAAFDERLLDALRNSDASQRDWDSFDEFWETVQTEGPFIDAWRRVHDREMKAFWEKVSGYFDNQLGCVGHYPGHQYSNYLGFADLRPYSISHPLAMAVLAAPQKLRQATDSILITGNYGPIFGGPAFASTVYTMHDPKKSGAMCAQACLIMALSMVSDRGSQLRGSFTLSYRALQKKYPNQARTFKITGISPEICATLLSELDTSSMHSPIDGPNFATMQAMMIAILEGNIRARFPTILFVDGPTWSEKEFPIPPHAVLCLGIRKLPLEEDRIIIHDPGNRPYREKPISFCAAAAAAFPREEPDAEGNLQPSDHINLVTACDKNIRFGSWDCLQALIDDSDHRRQTSALDPLAFAGNQRRVYIRLLTRQDLKDALPPTKPTGEGEEERRKDQARTRGEIRAWASQLPRSRYWCFYVTLNNFLERCDVYDAQAPVEHASQAWVSSFTVKDLTTTGQPCELDFFPDSLRIQDPDMLLPLPIPLAVKPKERKPPVGRSLEVSVMSSSSMRYLNDLARELTNTCDCHHMDLMILRDVDVNEIEAVAKSQRESPRLFPKEPDRHIWDMRSMSELIGSTEEADRHSKVGWISDWFVGELGNPADGDFMEISALATYFPNISSSDEALRQKDVDALTNTVLIGIELQRRGFMRNGVIVELVCGTIPEPSKSPPGQRSGIDIVDESEKRGYLLDSLGRIIDQVKAKTSEETEFALGLELEPGETYLLRNGETLKTLFDAIDKDEKLKKHVGLNVDIAHMRIAEGVSADDLEPFQSKIVHAHISDHPQMHTRDQPLGAWTPLEQRGLGYYPYIELLTQRLNNDDRTLPFSGVVAVELEGCNRIDWIRKSVSALRFLCQSAVK